MERERERERKGFKLCNPLCCTTQVKSILALPPSPIPTPCFSPSIFCNRLLLSPLWKLLLFRLPRSKNCCGWRRNSGITGCLLLQLLWKTWTLSAVWQQPFRQKGREDKWPRERVFDHPRCLCYCFPCEKPRSHIVCHNIHYQSCCWRSRFQEIKANRNFR